MIAINCNWIQISIVSWIRDILVRIRIRRSVPLTYGSEFILGSGLRIRIRIQIPDPGVRKAPDPDLLYCFLNVLLLFFCLLMEGSGSGYRSRSGSEQIMTDPDPGGSS